MRFSVQVYDGGLEQVGPGRARLRHALSALEEANRLLAEQHLNNAAIGYNAQSDFLAGSNENVCIGLHPSESLP